MKVQNKTIKELAYYFDQEFQKRLSVIALPDGGLLYKDFLIKRLPNENWGVYNTNNKDLVNQYYLKSCALLAAKFYSHRQFNQCSEVKILDNGYWSNHTDMLIFKNMLTDVTDDKYHILMTRYDESNTKSVMYRSRISKLFKHTFI